MRFASTRLGKDVIDLVDASVELGGRTLLDRLTWRLAPGERVGIVGVNGAGKSTLLRAIAGEVPLASGKRKVGVTVQLAYLSQEVRELERYAAWRVIDAIEDVRKYIRLGKKEISASQLAQRLGFTGGRQQTRVSDLSGGERRRLQLTRLLMAEPNVLLLDEPTNDLDIETLTSLEDLLDGWAGTLLVVSHDRYLLEPVPPGRPAPRRAQPSCVRHARRWLASRSSSPASPSARSGCTPRWSTRRRTMRECWSSTASSVTSSTSARSSSWPGWPPPRSPAEGAG